MENLIDINKMETNVVPQLAVAMLYREKETKAEGIWIRKQLEKHSQHRLSILQ